jgi:hypothetical protein
VVLAMPKQKYKKKKISTDVATLIPSANIRKNTTRNE